MKLDIKSFLIGVLITVNLFLLYGFTAADENENTAGRYRLEVTDYTNVWYDTHTGAIIGFVGNKELGKLFGGKATLSYEEILKKIEDAEQD
tara:strand:- start:19 stop:291 length:273 start_codon:yes stop_codon:yes gene_type:complete